MNNYYPSGYYQTKNPNINNTTMSPTTMLIYLIVGIAILSLGIFLTVYGLRIKKQKRLQAQKEREDNDINRLMQYKKLLDTGVISQEEFESKKSELLK